MFKSIQAFSSPSLISPSSRFSSKPILPSKSCFRSRKRRCNAVFASKRDAYGKNGNMVDENMMILRMRIHEMEVEERMNGGMMSGWIEWEKRYYSSHDYGSDICEGLGLLQRMLLEMRPSFALAMAALVLVSLPMSMGVVISHLIKVLAGL